MTPTVLSIAGTDPTGSAGLPADMKTIAALGGYGLNVVTAVVAQNSAQVRRIQPMNAETIRDQLRVLLEAMRIDAVKIGMLGTQEVVQVVSASLPLLGNVPIVLDPVLSASTGQGLLVEEAISAMQRELFPQVTFVTPNLKEASMLLREAEAQNCHEMARQARALQRHVPWVLLKGGHLADHAMSPDILVGPDGYEMWFKNERIRTVHGRGTGCTLSSALALFMISHDVPNAVTMAQDYVHHALQQAHKLDLVPMSGPLNHFYACA